MTGFETGQGLDTDPCPLSNPVSCLKSLFCFPVLNFVLKKACLEFELESENPVLSPFFQTGQNTYSEPSIPGGGGGFTGCLLI